jgi:hypothetical protein
MTHAQEHTDPVDLIGDSDYLDGDVEIQKITGNNNGTIIGKSFIRMFDFPFLIEWYLLPKFTRLVWYKF